MKTLSSRRQFLGQAATVCAGAALLGQLRAAPDRQPASPLRPRCIAMWDFSWIERRWSGGGFEDWSRALDELQERGYDAVRIDAFPHLVATDPTREWTLLPVWTVHDWGSPGVNRIRVQPGLQDFIGQCRDRGIKVGLSTWYREDTAKTRLKIRSAAVMAEQWVATLASIEQAGLLDSILYVDLCNEWPGDIWCPFFRNDPPELTWGGWYTAASTKWMKQACQLVRERFPTLPVGFSIDLRDPSKMAGKDLSFLDYAEPHLWMAQANEGEFYREIGYNYDRFSLDSYRALVEKGEWLYRSKPDYWQQLLRQQISMTAQAVRPHGLPIMTTECWAVVDYKDWPLLNWDWVQDLCRVGVESAAGTGQWLAIATSNFCGPQFRGMWRDIPWHRRATGVIRQARIRPELQSSRLAQRL